MTTEGVSDVDEQTDAVIPAVTIDEYGTMWRGEQIIGDIEPVDEGSDVSVVAVWDMGALLDALDAVPRDEYVRTNDTSAELYRQAVDRAERAERERDALRADNDRLREGLRCIQGEAKAGSWFHRVVTYALSADADADAEPKKRTPDSPRWCGECQAWGDHHTDRHPATERYDLDCTCSNREVDARGDQIHTADCAMSRAQGGDWPEAVSGGLTIPCMRCGEIPAVDCRVDGDFWREVTAPHERKNVVCIECLCRDHEEVADHLEQVQIINGGVTVVLEPTEVVNHRRYAEGGRPREADDASVDAEGDDGRSRAIEEATDAIAHHILANWYEDIDPAEGQPEHAFVWNNTPSVAEAAIDAALASGGVAPREDVLHEREWGNAHFADWQRERDTRQRIEAALRDLLHAQQSPVDGTCPHCGSQACYEADSGMPLGVLRCDETGLAVISSTARGDIYEPLWVRARAVLESSDG